MALLEVVTVKGASTKATFSVKISPARQVTVAILPPIVMKLTFAPITLLKTQLASNTGLVHLI